MTLCGVRSIIQKRYSKATVFFAVIIVILVGILITKPKNWLELRQSQNDEVKVSQQTLKTIDASKIPENAIYLMETSGLPMLSPKQLCAVESAALHHPNRSVVMAVNNKFLQLPIVLKSWSEMYPNVMFINLDIVQWLNGTILLPWLSKNLLDKSPFKTPQASNALRYATLFKYGGFYLDTDVIVLRPMDDLVNAVGLYSTTGLNGAAMAFDKHHPFMEACMNELSANFNPYKWGSNGPDLLTRVINTYCNFNATNLLKPGYCKGIRILDIMRSIIQNRYSKSTVLFALINVILVGMLISKRENMLEFRQTKNNEVQQTLKTIDPTKIPENGIYFLETSGLPMLSPKQLCAVESAALHHPNRSVVVAVKNKFLQLPSVVKSWSEKYKNIMFTTLDIVQWLNGTILLPWLSKNLFDKSPFKTTQSSNVLRYVTLFKSGGLYLDTDVIVMRPMYDLMNAVGLQSTNVINNAVMAFEKHHPYIEACLKEVFANFNPYKWGSNGPNLLTRVINTFCNFNATNLLKPGDCKGIRILDISAFYPVPHTSWQTLFNHDQNISATVLRKAEQSYLLHYWNKMSVDEPIQLPIVLKSWSERYPNVMFIHLDIVQWLNGTILLPWLSKNLFDKSPFKTAQSSNVLRPMDDLVNAVGLQSTKEVNNAVMAFEKHHPYIEACLKDVSAKFNPYKWGSNGPGLLTRVIHTFCNFNKTNSLKAGYCKGIRILDSMYKLQTISHTPVKTLEKLSTGEDLDLLNPYKWGSNGPHLLTRCVKDR
ncbi:unnamed protein product [Notodromas monacha]|uniref:Alpha 1,4-glycosyltransferase domain-containing protein n=1 Tax=Notodromas monacha TaxID=399045 RepID=A0A7R9GC86_9CRUS|nr:unnamed protein product [Notodromas monacha]CAG0915854.1 unnamed protein product [Notodromas monacha]